MNAAEDFKRAAKGCIDSRNRLVIQNLPLVRKLIRVLKHRFKASESADLHQAGVFGLMRAVTKYRPEVGAFAPYACTAIRRAMQDHAKRDRVIQNAVCHQAERDYFDTLLANEQASTWDVTDRATVTRCLECLPEKERAVIQMHFVEGESLRRIGQLLPRTSTGNRVSHSNVNRIKSRALKRLKKCLQQK